VSDLDYGESSMNVDIGVFNYVLRDLDKLAYDVAVVYEVILPTQDLTL
jgi:hypothetical protein